MKTTGDQNPGVMDLQSGGLIEDQDLFGLKMNNVNMGAAKFSDVNLMNAHIRNSCLVGLVVGADCNSGDAMVAVFPIADALQEYREKHGWKV